MRLFSGLTCVLALSCPAYAVPTQWGGNGHYYELVSPVDGITWSDARDAAAASSHLGFDGHLVTFTSQAEWDFITTTFADESDWVWIGLSDAELEGDYRWVTGEAFGFDAWGATEPNNAGDEDYVWYQVGTTGSGEQGLAWNDHDDVTVADTGADQFPLSYIVEYDDVPEPASAMLLVVGGVLLGRRRR